MNVEWRLCGKGMGPREGGQGIRIFKVHYIHARKCHSELRYFVQLTYAIIIINIVYVSVWPCFHVLGTCVEPLPRS
jgi:hypothetical protein